ncbi:hypothetical protein L6452_05892 [Arctium lappa]|uniref:Uncharacterized protein n=1 Tax=Arctium lappa TaxID=4217 RepID=A0ACB9EHL3_ARCLA|nr:hypothetical protein L6452_05892 [Arctium lappa]
MVRWFLCFLWNFKMKLEELKKRETRMISKEGCSISKGLFDEREERYIPAARSRERLCRQDGRKEKLPTRDRRRDDRRSWRLLWEKRTVGDDYGRRCGLRKNERGAIVE